MDERIKALREMIIPLGVSWCVPSGNIDSFAWKVGKIWLRADVWGGKLRINVRNINPEQVVQFTRDLMEDGNDRI